MAVSAQWYCVECGCNACALCRCRCFTISLRVHRNRLPPFKFCRLSQCPHVHNLWHNESFSTDFGASREIMSCSGCTQHGLRASTNARMDLTVVAPGYRTPSVHACTWGTLYNHVPKVWCRGTLWAANSSRCELFPVGIPAQGTIISRYANEGTLISDKSVRIEGTL